MVVDRGVAPLIPRRSMEKGVVQSKSEAIPRGVGLPKRLVKSPYSSSPRVSSKRELSRAQKMSTHFGSLASRLKIHGFELLWSE